MQGAIALASVIAEHGKLVNLGMKLNFVKDQGALALARAVAKSNITSFFMAGNEFEDTTLVQVQSASYITLLIWL